MLLVIKGVRHKVVFLRGKQLSIRPIRIYVLRIQGQGVGNIVELSLIESLLTVVIVVGLLAMVVIRLEYKIENRYLH